MKPSSLYSPSKFVYLTGQWRHSLEVHPLLRKILDPPLCCVNNVAKCRVEMLPSFLYRFSGFDDPSSRKINISNTGHAWKPARASAASAINITIYFYSQSLLWKYTSCGIEWLFAHLFHGRGQRLFQLVYSYCKEQLWIFKEFVRGLVDFDKMIFTCLKSFCVSSVALLMKKISLMIICATKTRVVSVGLHGYDFCTMKQI